VFVTIKLIITDNSEITSHIIMLQIDNRVKSEAFEALSAFHKSLEDFYNIFNFRMEFNYIMKEDLSNMLTRIFQRMKLYL